MKFTVSQEARELHARALVVDMHNDTLLVHKLTGYDMARRHRNLYLEFCSSWAGLGKIERAVDICGVEQMLFGSDMDLIDPAFVLGAYEDAHLTDEQLRTIYWDNAVRVLGLS